jgi:hypothetical protein
VVVVGADAQNCVDITSTLQLWLGEKEWLSMAATLRSVVSQPAAAESSPPVGAVAVAYCVARAYQLPLDFAYVRPLARRLLLGSDVPATLWLLDGYDELDAADSMAEELRTAAMQALLGRRRPQHGPERDVVPAANAQSEMSAPPAATPLAAALRLLVSQAHTAVTTRPAFALSIGCLSYVRLEPLAREDVVSFASAALGGISSRPWGRLEARMASSTGLADSLRTPVILQVGKYEV